MGWLRVAKKFGHGEGTSSGGTATYAESSGGAGVELAERPTESASFRFREFVLAFKFGAGVAADEATELARSWKRRDVS